MDSHSAEASGSTPGAEPHEATPTAPDALRAVVLLISDGKIVRRVTGPVPLNIVSAADWQPNRQVIEERYSWLCRMMGGVDPLIKLALDVMAR